MSVNKKFPNRSDRILPEKVPVISEEIEQNKDFGDKIGHDQFVHPLGLTGVMETGITEF